MSAIDPLSFIEIHRSWGSHYDYAEIKNEVVWEQHEALIMGRRIPTPRLTAFQAETSSYSYKYSGILNLAGRWSPIIAAIRQRLSEQRHGTYNVALINLYRTGQDSNGWHADDEREGVPRTPIASLSFGGTRRFGLRPKRAKNNKDALFLDLDHGDLVIMLPGCQEHFAHSVPKTARPVMPRINITFREFWEVCQI